MTRASEAEYTAYQNNGEYLEIAELFGASTRDLIDGANSEPTIPQILYMMNGKPEDLFIQGNSFLKKNLMRSSDKSKTLWLSILNRPLKASERHVVAARAENIQDLQDMIWALLNSNEFRFVR
jgi:hypothetical protein